MVSRRSHRAQALVCALSLLVGSLFGAAACGPGDRFQGPLGGVDAVLDAKARTLTLESHGRQLAHLDLGRVAFGRGEASYEMQFGMFRIEEYGGSEPVRPDGVRLVEAPAEGPVRFELLFGESVLGAGELSVEVEGHLALRLTPADATLNRSFVSLACAQSDHFAGLGAQSHDVDHRGQIVPLWVSEQGVGKLDSDEEPLLWQVVGRRHTTHVPIPAFVTSRGSAIAVETWAFARFDLCATRDDEVVLESWEPGLTLHLFDGPSPLEAVSRLTAFTGRPRVPPPWAFAPWNDAIFGSDSVRDLASFLRDNEIPSSAIWSEDWRGGNDSGDLYRLEEDWNLDREVYPDYEALVAELKQAGFAHQVYFNTFLTEGADVFPEADESGYAIQDAAGGTFLFDGADADFSPTGLVDLTNEAARAFTKEHLQGALDLGARGWMADFAEWMPVDGVKLASGEDPALVHNRYPVLWAELNDEVVRESGLADEVNVYMRSGHLFSQRHVQILWAGDQRTSFEADDGLPTVVPIGLGVSAVGFPFYAHDIAGYQSSTNDPTTKELFFRWTELGALTPVMRTHHGTHARFNWNLRSDEETTAHYKRYAELHVRLYPYLRGLAHRAVDDGRPLWIAMGLLYPDDEAAWPIKDQLFLGDALLVAPVMTGGATSREVYFPAGRFAPWLSAGDAIEGPLTTSVPAPLAEIPVFLRAGGIVPMTAEPAQTLLAGDFGVPGLESTEGDRVVYVGLGASGSFEEESGARYALEGSGTGLAGLALDDEGAVVISGNGKIEGEGFALTLSGHPEGRVTRVFFR